MRLPEVLDRPTTMQEELEEHDTALRLTRFGGVDCACQVAPPSVVSTTVLRSTAMHAEVVGHETPDSALSPEGSGSFVHVVPPSLVVMLTPPEGPAFPTAMQSELLGQETALRA
jgi:hypothetical protein